MKKWFQVIAVSTFALTGSLPSDAYPYAEPACVNRCAQSCKDEKSEADKLGCFKWCVPICTDLLNEAKRKDATDGKSDLLRHHNTGG